MTKVVITQWNNQRFLLIYEDNELVEFHPLQMESTLQINNIYIGRVEKVVKNIQSAFIRLDSDNVGYLPLNDKPALVLNRRLPKGLSSIAEGDKILVQVEQEPQKMKQARVTGNICFHGNYIALDLQKGVLGVSKKIRNPDRVNELRKLILNEQSYREDGADRQNEVLSTDTDENCTLEYGCVLRTACENASNEAIIEEYRCLYETMKQLIHKANYERNTGCIHAGQPEHITILSDYGMNRIDVIETDLQDIHYELLNFSKDILTVDNKPIDVVLYEDKEYPLYKLLGLETEWKRLTNKKVWLKSGGFLVIEPTEAMVVIDVNTGKSIGKKNKDNHILKLNLEAAAEVTKQLRLRNLSGIIMIDFINMKNDEDKQQVVKCLEQGLKKDKIPGYFIEITKLDVFELTRKKIRRPLHEVINCNF